MRRIMLVDDENLVLRALQRVISRRLADEEVRVETFEDPRAALRRAAEVGFDVVVSDYRMPIMDGVSFLVALKEIQPDTVRLILSAQADLNALVSAINQAELFRFLAKPWLDEELLVAVRLAFARRDKLLAERRLADERRLQIGLLTPEELELRRLEEEEPGITKVNWGHDGSVILDEVVDAGRER